MDKHGAEPIRCTECRSTWSMVQADRDFIGDHKAACCELDAKRRSTRQAQEMAQWRANRHVAEPFRTALNDWALIGNGLGAMTKGERR